MTEAQLKAAPWRDKATWGAGPWQSEPDRVDFIAHGFACLALRHPDHGHFCGYVGVPEGHPRYGGDYDVMADLEFHGGINYTAACEEGGLICHAPAPGMPDKVWWIGGDFGHVWDKCPGRDAFARFVAAENCARGWIASAELLEREPRQPLPAIYRPLPYVRAEITALAAQLAAMEAP